MALGARLESRNLWKSFGVLAAFLALFAGTDQGAVGKDIKRQALVPRPPGGFGGGPIAFMALSTGTDQGVVCGDVGCPTEVAPALENLRLFLMNCALKSCIPDVPIGEKRGGGKVA